jgi:hypothetical protein
MWLKYVIVKKNQYYVNNHEQAKKYIIVSN